MSFYRGVFIILLFSGVVSAHNEEAFSNKAILCCRGRRKVKRIIEAFSKRLLLLTEVNNCFNTYQTSGKLTPNGSFSSER